MNPTNLVSYFISHTNTHGEERPTELTFMNEYCQNWCETHIHTLMVRERERRTICEQSSNAFSFCHILPPKCNNRIESSTTSSFKIRHYPAIVYEFAEYIDKSNVYQIHSHVEVSQLDSQNKCIEVKVGRFRNVSSNYLFDFFYFA